MPSFNNKSSQGKGSKDFSLSLNKQTVKEGKSFKAFLSSSEQYKWSPIYWLLSGENITADDLADGQLSGSDSLKKDGSFSKIFDIKADCLQEGVETLEVQFFLDPKFKKLAAKDSIQIIDTSYDPDDCGSSDITKPYAIIESRLQIKENTSLYYTITNGEPGKKLFFRLSGKNINKHDFDLNYGRPKGQIKIGEDGQAFIPFLVRNDNKTEGEEQLTFGLFKDKKHKKKLSSVTIPIQDTSLQTDENKPTKSVEPNSKQQTWSSFEPEGTWFTLSPSRPEIRENTSTRTRIDSNAPAGTKLNYEVRGPGIDEDDFDLNYARMSGSVELNSNGVAFIPHLLRNDNKTEGTEELTIDLYRDGNRKARLATTTVPVLDTSVQSDSSQPPTPAPAPDRQQPTWGGGTTEGTWFTLSPSRSEFEEGETSTTRIDSDAFPGTTVYWEMSGSGINEDDLDLEAGSSGLSGVKTITKNGFGEIRHIFKVDGVTEGDEIANISLYRDQSKTERLASTSFTVVDGAVKTEANKSSLNEGQKMKFKVFASGFPAGSNLYWDISGVNINQDDFDTRPIEGLRILDATQKFQLNFQTRKDNITEGTEFYRLSVYSDPEKSTLIGQSDDITIFDTSTAPVATYELTTSSSLVEEGPGFKVKIKTKKVDPGTTVFWKATGTASEQDIINETTGDALGGPVILGSDGNAIMQFRTIKDQLTEGLETFSVQAFSDSLYLNPVSDIVTVDILDTSTTPVATYDLITSSPSVEEGKGFKVKIKTKKVDPGTTVFWKATGTASEQDLINETTGDALGGAVILGSDGNATMQFRTIKDRLTEGLETFSVQAFTDSDYLNPVGNLVSVDIQDTSTGTLT